MRIINKKYLLIILLVGIILTGVIIFKPKEEVKLNNVVLKQEINNKTFAMYKEDGEGYSKVDGSKFPERYILNITKSKCIDNNGQEIKDALSYENDKVVLKSNKSSYCYLYFDKSLGEEIKEDNPQGLSAEIKGAMYRFQGQAKDANNNELVNNYICFGTSEKDKCVEDTDHYMYRIIGIEVETGRVKVIKKEALKDTYKWANNDQDNIEFPDSKIYEAIKGNGFLTNTEYVPEGWEEKISDNTWMYGDMITGDFLGARQTGEGLYQTETGQKETTWYNWADEHTNGAIETTVGYTESPYAGNTIYYTNGKEVWADTFTGKVSLMYLHDYHYSVSDTANCQYDEGADAYSKCQTGWMHLSNNDTGAPNPREWTMSRGGWSTWAGWFHGHYVNNTGCTYTAPTIDSLSVRPVFYLASVNQLSDGSGTPDDPFIIKS